MYSIGVPPWAAKRIITVNMNIFTLLAVCNIKIVLSLFANLFLFSYPDATPDDLDSANNVCIICREEMVTRCKKLPCNHIFHMACLRSWFQRQQTCPTCRMDVLSQTVLSQLNQAQARRQQQQQQQQQNPPQGEGAVPQQEGQGTYTNGGMLQLLILCWFPYTCA